MTPSFSSAFNSAMNRALMNGRQPALLLIGEDMASALRAEPDAVSLVHDSKCAGAHPSYCGIPFHLMAAPGLALITRPSPQPVDSGFDTP